jgi:hypothetical protein
MDLAHTRRVLEALHAAHLDDEAVFARAREFLKCVQRHPSSRHPQPPGSSPEQSGQGEIPYDGGFYFSPVVLGANKGRLADSLGAKYFRSYATATCDGILALLAAGVPRDDERVTTGLAWLHARPNLDRPAGIPMDRSEPWDEALYFYHLAVRAEVYSKLGWPSAARTTVTELLSSKQQADGSFANQQSHLMKEDDPLLCTALAVIALSHATD